ncbi:flagellar basal body-associated FliL family protein [Roseburia sp. NSJ-9]|jgi:flagellar basal body-associated protein FliL|uniref:Flagellar protein FliL n=1 Tax=Roseburia lenta TaxID=2763061 RepID=A0ABR7GER7_9FIRM|nr:MULTISPECIES: flagellar basal body-associated FliL family protein [Roseburia]MBC5685291.1 flagellar basal body-associated FliL family protein [Roseburia lenta]RHO32051.1 flagellar basal body-associated protein FliL [Roseburia sp. AM16-25]
MKKNLITVITLALVVVNLVLTVILTITILPETQKANELITKVCSAIDLDLESGSATSNANIPIDQIEVYNIDDEQTINLKQDGDGKDHFAMLTVSISMDTKNSDYKDLKPQVEEKVNLIKGDINNIVSQYTIDEIKNNQSAVQDEILKDLQKMFGSDFIVAVGFPTAQYQ